MDGIKFSYRRPDDLKQYLDESGRIKSRRKTGLSSDEQRSLEQAVKRARHLALL